MPRTATVATATHARLSEIRLVGGMLAYRVPDYISERVDTISQYSTRHGWLTRSGWVQDNEASGVDPLTRDIVAHFKYSANGIYTIEFRLRTVEAREAVTDACQTCGFARIPNRNRTMRGAATICPICELGVTSPARVELDTSDWNGSEVSANQARIEEIARELDRATTARIPNSNTHNSVDALMAASRATARRGRGRPRTRNIASTNSPIGHTVPLEVGVDEALPDGDYTTEIIYDPVTGRHSTTIPEDVRRSIILGDTERDQYPDTAVGGTYESTSMRTNFFNLDNDTVRELANSTTSGFAVGTTVGRISDDELTPEAQMSIDDELDGDEDREETVVTYSENEGATEFITAENIQGIFTVVNNDGTEYLTIRIKRPRPGQTMYEHGRAIVEYLSGSNNESDYTGFGFLHYDETNINGRVSIWRRFRDGNRPSFIAALEDAVLTVLRDPIASGERYAIRSNRCFRCNRRLTVPASLHRGLGPECAARYGF